MSAYQNFIFEDYLFDERTKKLRLYYSLDGIIEFSESYHFDFDFGIYDSAVLDRAIQSLFFMAGVSYYKAYLPENIVVEKGELDDASASFFAKTYQKGLGEFFYLNKLSPKTAINFKANVETLTPVNQQTNTGLLVGLGGGKDSLVSVELLRDNNDITTWSVGHRTQLTPLVERIGLNHLWVEREWDRALLEHNAANALNGHIPISAILACVGSVVAILSGNRSIVVSNERSANEADLIYEDMPINHQYSKSIEFEKDYQKHLIHTLGANIEYYSYLRPLSELFIAEVFSKIGLDKYKDVFSSCNRAFTHQSDHIFWCGECAKCAFTFLALTPFVERSKLESLWGKNLLLDPNLDKTYRNLLGIAGDKPLDCVGEIKESRAAMRLAQKIYPELSKYQFDLPDDYDYRSIESHEMPDDLFRQLKPEIEKLKSN